MLTRVFFGTLVALSAIGPASYAATTIGGTYSATDVSTPSADAPTINDAASGFLPSPFSESLTIGSPTTPTTFLLIGPVPGSGTVTGVVSVAFHFTDPSGASVTGVTSTPGSNVATLSGGTVNIAANFELFYGNETDCVTWSSTTCTTNSGGTITNTTLGDTLVVTFADGTVLDVNLYNWSDWVMSPNISFTLVSNATKVPEPASVALLGTAIGGIALIRRRRRAAASS